MTSDTTPSPDKLPPRELPRRRSGRHRDPLSFDDALGTPTLVLVAPQEEDNCGAELAELVRTYRPEVPVRLGYASRGVEGLSALFRELDAVREQPFRAVAVPLVAAPDQQLHETIAAAVTESGVAVSVTEGLGPHPMLAELLHLRLAESGFVRADRMRLISVVAAGSGMTDGVVVGATGGADADAAAGVSAVLLAARLGVTVLPAVLDAGSSVDDAFAQLRDAGAQHPVLAPCLLGTRDELELADQAVQRAGAQRCAPLGASTILAKIVALRYAEVLNAVGLDNQPTEQDLPAPAGSRHRTE
ncbi:cobalamin biosynthesis protein CbiX [Lipingzhangella sp. LS1_29]|uniref:Cobalamin biosynthesis protein CbiX n=1 Tax=Lipingzhangella rawalii TaxID=2055835 RepID=A0ABU2H7Y9_9ACTN|nr:cobalamin biosynthesis protein CbiX [Lipingzhangella rawalii]MDS1271398.1 cobalamin biosynthesis protein CbiX [Lipingzhangella rawalii]